MIVGGMVAAWLVHLSPHQVVQVCTLDGDTVVVLDKTLYSHGASLHPGV